MSEFRKPGDDEVEEWFATQGAALSRDVAAMLPGEGGASRAMAFWSDSAVEYLCGMGGHHV